MRPQITIGRIFLKIKDTVHVLSAQPYFSDRVEFIDNNMTVLERKKILISG